MIRSLLYYKRVHFAVLLAVITTTAVLTGALLVGDSVRGTLRDLVLDRLGRIEAGITAQHFFREQLADMLHGAPAILLTGTVRTDSGLRASGVQMMGVDPRFSSLFGNASSLSSLFQEKADQSFPSVVINQTLQKELSVNTGDQVILLFEKQGDVHRESFLGSREPSEMRLTLRLSVTAILSDHGPGAFTLRPNQNAPRIAYVSLLTLQNALQQKNGINAILSEKEAGAPALRKFWNPDDAGLRIRESGDILSIESKEILISDRIAQAVRKVAQHLSVSTESVFTYLANTIRVNNRTIPYSTVAALEIPGLQKDEILLNEWAAKDLQAKEGDTVEITYYIVGSGNELLTGSHSFHLKAVLPMQGLGADSTLTPDYPGMHDVEHISEWSPPFSVDFSLIRPVDEQYWEQYRAAPKAFISLETGQQLWKSRFGLLTSIRVPNRPGLKDLFSKQLPVTLSPDENGFVFLPLKRKGLNSAEGATDFSGLFVGFSFFLMFSAALLISLLFRLGVELRVGEIGLLLSTGFPVKAVQRRFLAEGMMVAIPGAILGAAAGLLYARLLLYGLSNWWSDAIGTSALSLHVTTWSLVTGLLVSTLIALFAIWRTTRVISKASPILLLAGTTILLEEHRDSPIAKRLAIVVTGISLLLVPIGFSRQGPSAAVLFFAAGGCLLTAAIAWTSVLLRRSHRKPLRLHEGGALYRMAGRNSSRNAGRSLVSIALVCCATFILVSVGSNRKSVLDFEEGTGGYPLIAQSDIPTVQDLNLPESRAQLGWTQETLPDLDILSFRVLPGEDASCLNLYRPENPSILGVPDILKRNSKFRFHNTIVKTRNPWDLLNAPGEPGVLPAIGDYNSITWILHLGLNQDLVINDEFGKPLKLRFVALLENSIFQSEILISEKNFMQHFPSATGYSYFLIRSKSGRDTQLALQLERLLEPFGFDVSSSSERIASYHAVENTYLSTFLALGGLGLILGTLGLAILLIRNTSERRGELATLQAIGYPKLRIEFLILMENVFLIGTGLLAGSLCALLAAAPQLVVDATTLPWGSLGFLAGLVLLTGTIAGALAVHSALKLPLLPALKTDL